jgi:hypothetical protein
MYSIFGLLAGTDLPSAILTQMLFYKSFLPAGSLAEPFKIRPDQYKLCLKKCSIGDYKSPACGRGLQIRTSG